VQASARKQQDGSYPSVFSITKDLLYVTALHNNKPVDISSDMARDLRPIFRCLLKQDDNKKECGDILWRPSELISGSADLAIQLASKYFVPMARSEESEATYAKRNENIMVPSLYIGSQQTLQNVNVRDSISKLREETEIIESGKSLTCKQPIQQDKSSEIIEIIESGKSLTCKQPIQQDKSDKSWDTKMRYGAAVAGLGGLGFAAEAARRLAKSPSKSPKGQR